MSTIQLINTRTLINTIIAVFLSAYAHNVFAKDYRVEVLLFENLNDSQNTPDHAYKPPKKITSGSQTWHLSPSMLVSEANALRRSPSYKLLHHFSWGQKSLPYAKSASYAVLKQYMQGWIKVYANRLLFVNLDLDYNGYRINEKRRLKLNERHYFDHPKFGVLMQVSRLENKK